MCDPLELRDARDQFVHADRLALVGIQQVKDHVGVPDGKSLRAKPVPRIIPLHDAFPLGAGDGRTMGVIGVLKEIVHLLSMHLPWHIWHQLSCLQRIVLNIGVNM